MAGGRVRGVSVGVSVREAFPVPGLRPPENKIPKNSYQKQLTSTNLGKDYRLKIIFSLLEAEGIAPVRLAEIDGLIPYATTH